MSDIGFIVGSGFAQSGFEVMRMREIETPFGEPSGPVLTLAVAGREMACIARHGPAHTIAPHEVNYRANVWALHLCGVRRLVGLNAVGSIAPDFAPGELAVPDQLIDYTWGRESSFGPRDGRIVHADLTEPFDSELSEGLRQAIAGAGSRCHGGTYGVTQGPRLETAAEVDRLERDGCAMVGMTALPEAALARELDIRYVICAFSVNRAAGRGEAPLNAQIETNLEIGIARARRALALWAART